MVEEFYGAGEVVQREQVIRGVLARELHVVDRAGVPDHLGDSGPHGMHVGPNGRLAFVD